MTLLERYITVATFKALVVASAGLTSLFSLLEFVDQLHDVGKGHYRVIDALVYVLLTAPARALQLMPVSMLLGCLFALGALATRSELTAMRASGLSPGRMVGSVFKLGAATVIALLLAAEFVIPAAQQMAQAQRASRLSSAQAVRSGNSFWAQGDHQYLNVRQFEGGNIPRDIYVYEFAASGELQTLIRADHADVRPDGIWLLKQVSRQQFSGNRSAAEGIPGSAGGATRGNRSAAQGIPGSAGGATRGNRIESEQFGSLAWRPFLRPRQASLLILPPQSMQPVELYQYVRELQRRHQPVGRYAQELWTKIDLPLAMAAMIMIAVPFVFGPLRTQSIGQRVMLGAVIGIVFSLAQQITTYLGELLNVSPALTATLPSFLFMALGLYLFRRAVV